MGKVADKLRVMCDTDKEDLFREITDKRCLIGRLQTDIVRLQSEIRRENVELAKLVSKYVNLYPTESID